MKTLFYRFQRDSSGATSIEYALIAILASVTIVAGATAIGVNLGIIFVDVREGFPE